MKRLRAGLVGAGLVGQAEHAFYLWEDRERFDFVGLADASVAVRNALGARYGIQQLHADLPSLLKATKLDALVIAAPDPFHPDLAVTALEAGLHVLCEKPLSLTLSGCDRIKAARDKAGKVLQVAYMKRHDPAFKNALDLLPSKIEDVKLISVEVNDPDQNPFVAHLPMTVADDLPAALRDQFRTANTAQLRESAGRDPSAAGARALSGGFLSSLVHDVGVVHGMLAHLDHQLPAEADHGSFFDNGAGVELGFGLPGGGRVRMTHLNLPGVPDYTERVTVYCIDRIIELVFPSPYLRNFPTKLTLRKGGDNMALETQEFRVSYEEAFREQLRAFHAAACGEAPVKTPLEQARRDVEFLISAYKRAEP
ncbi:Gfo/Idh/MocA family protein [Dongia sedimenti]|uniref:Gfo/Idh/MocA family oxidoreductase n=1 Tax=Dongia sedimenti TaxID=3064282 RepID=A0ABU0YFB4_9PROT|nr:Gfo/Idh/MocA family oxidoreductase [Rhodospirillaceae bacterium R-7]